MIRTDVVRPVERKARPPARVAAKLAEQYAAVGLHDRARQISSVHERARQITADTTMVDADLARLRDEAVQSVVTGERSCVEAALALDASQRIVAPLVIELAAKAKLKLLSDLSRSLWNEGDALIAEVDVVVQECAAAIASASPIFGSITTDTEAIRASTKASNAWSVAVAAAERVTLCRSLTYALRIGGFVPDLRDADAADWWYRHPELVVIDHDPSTHPMLRLARSIANGAQPGAITADEVAALRADLG
jgi:hypothetical protein